MGRLTTGSPCWTRWADALSPVRITRAFVALLTVSWTPMAIWAIPNQARNAANRAVGVNTPTETTATVTSTADRTKARVGSRSAPIHGPMTTSCLRIAIRPVMRAAEAVAPAAVSTTAKVRSSIGPPT